MDFRDSPQEAAFRTRLRDWLSTHAKEFPTSGDEYWAKAGDWHRALYEGGFFGLSWPTEYGARALHNGLTQAWAGREDDLERAGAALTALSDQVIKARKDGDLDLAPVYAGQAAGLVGSVRGAAEVVADLAGYQDLLRAAADRLT